MKIDDVLRLVDAGFSKADIIALASGQVTPISPQDPQVNDKPTQPDPGPEPEPAKDPEPAQEPSANNREMQQIKAQIAALQQANLQAASQPDGANKQQTAEDVWKDFFEKGD